MSFGADIGILIPSLFENRQPEDKKDSHERCPHEMEIALQYMSGSRPRSQQPSDEDIRPRETSVAQRRGELQENQRHDG